MIYVRRALLGLLLVLVLQSTCAASSLVVAPSSAQVKPKAQVQFTAVGLSGGGVVVWSLSGNGCVGTACGEIDYDGNYTAPAVVPNPPQVSVVATSISDVTQWSSATVTIGSSVSVSVAAAPSSVSLGPDGQQQFSATVSGSSNTARVAQLVFVARSLRSGSIRLHQPCLRPLQPLSRLPLKLIQRNRRPPRLPLPRLLRYP